MHVSIVDFHPYIFTFLFRFISCGFDFKKGPMKNSSCRKKVINGLFYLNARIYMFWCGVLSSKTEVDIDYTYYLGPDYKSGYRNIKQVSTFVSNHVSWIDT